MTFNKKVIDEAIAEARVEKEEAIKDGESIDQDWWYGFFDTAIDAGLGDDPDDPYGTDDDDEDRDDELRLERHVFAAIRKACKKKHNCDPSAADNAQPW